VLTIAGPRGLKHLGTPYLRLGGDVWTAWQRIDRYLINSPMLPNMKKNEDGSLTLYIWKDSPGADKESNWLPAPNDLIYLVMRLYWPNTEPPSVLPPGEGTWKPPGIVKAK
jgi:hypothetical protein